MDLGHYTLLSLLSAAVIYIGFLLRWIQIIRQDCACGASDSNTLFPLGLKTLLDKQRKMHQKWGDETFAKMSPNIQRAQLKSDEM